MRPEKRLGSAAALGWPVGRVVEIVAIWIVLKGEQIPRLVTLYPGA